jgi:hypothetical protein
MFKKILSVLFITSSMNLFGDVINIEGATNITTTSSQVNAIIVDGNGNMSQQVFPYNPQNQQVDVGSASQGENASIYFTLFMMGFMWWDGYWVGHNGYYWDGHTNVYVKNVNWNNHWNNYWHNTWNQKWNNYYNKHKNDPNFPYKNQKSWPHHSGQFPSHDHSPSAHHPHFQQEDHNFQQNRKGRDFHHDH